LSLGFLALAVASFTFSGLQLGWIAPGPNWSMVGLVVLALAVPLQAASTIFGFLARDPIAATGMGILTGSWLALGIATYTSPTAGPTPAVGLLLIGSSVALLVPATVGFTGKILAAAVITGASLRFGLTGAFEMTGSSHWRLAAGASGLALAALAVYAALAFELETMHKREVLPAGRRGANRLALAGTFAEEVADIQHEPGVRRRL
jgi:succinate-acetate transporter protein